MKSQVFLLYKFGSQLSDSFFAHQGVQKVLLWSLIFHEILIIYRHLLSFRCTEGKRQFHLASLFVMDLCFSFFKKNVHREQILREITGNSSMLNL